MTLDHHQRRRAVAGAAAVLLAAVLPLVSAGPALADTATAPLTQAVQAAAQAATGQGYRTGIAVLDLQTGAYAGAGDDTAPFASESVVKVMIAAQLLLSGQMNGAVESQASDMITRSDDGAADALYDLAGGDDLVPELADRYGIADLGTPPSEDGWWGNTHITAKGMVELYGALAKDPAVAPWLTKAMASATQTAADGTDQFFGLPAAITGAAIKQGWGDDGDDSADAVFNSTGYVAGGTYAVAILTEGPPDSYGDAISAVVTAEAQALMPNGTVAGADAAAPVTPAAPAAPAVPLAAAGGSVQAAAPPTGIPASLTRSPSGFGSLLARAGIDGGAAAALLAMLVLPWRRRQGGRHARLP